MLAIGTGVLQRGRAVAAITTYTLESTAAIVAAAERLNLPVLLSAGVSSYGAVGREPLAAAALAAARAAPASRSASTSTTVASRRSSTPASRSATARS